MQSLRSRFPRPGDDSGEVIILDALVAMVVSLFVFAAYTDGDTKAKDTARTSINGAVAQNLADEVIQDFKAAPFAGVDTFTPAKRSDAPSGCYAEVRQVCFNVATSVTPTTAPATTRTPRDVTVKVTWKNRAGQREHTSTMTKRIAPSLGEVAPDGMHQD